MSDNDENSRMYVPQNDIDFNFIAMNNVWGSDQISDPLKETFKQYSVYKDEKGMNQVTYHDLWSLLQIFTRDLRLSNLSEWNNELQTVRSDLKLASDFLQEGFTKPSLVCLSNPISIMETAQSKNGFLRKRMNTFTKESSHQELEPPKKSFFFGGNKNQQQGGNR